MTLLLALLLTSAVLAIPAVRRLRSYATALLPLPMVVVVGVLLSWAPDVLAGDVKREVFASVPVLATELAFRLDGLGLLFALLVCGIGALVLVHAGGYFRDKPSVFGRFVALAYVFAFAMVGLVLADDVLTLFVAWELTSICSFLLVGLEHGSSAARSGAQRALLVTGAGGVALLVGLLLLADVAGTTSIGALLERGDVVRDSSAYLPILGLIAFAAFTKSAQVPFHYWLPGAMAAPGPISAFLHSATLVKAGVFLLARMHPVLGFRPEWSVLLGHVGAATLLVGAVLAFVQNDLKRMLAYTTVAGLGTLVLLLGIGTEPALRAAMLFVAVHALYKASLFLIVGYLEKRTGTRDVTRLSGLATRAPAAFAAALLAALSMSGLPPLLGAISKELVYEAKLAAPEAPVLLTIVGSVGNALVIGCAVLVGLVPFLRRQAPPFELRRVPEGLLLMGPLVLAALGLLLGLLHDTTAAPIIEAAVAATVGEPPTQEFALDAAPGLVSWASKATLLAGVLVVAFRRHLLRAGTRLGALATVGPTALHDRLLEALFATGSAVSNAFLRGGVRQSLVWPFLLLVGVGVVLVAGGTGEGPLPSLDLDPLRVSLVLLVLGGAVGAARASSNYTAVASLGVTGFGVGMLFLVLGGPDLAMTQIAVETLAVLLLLSVLGRKPVGVEPKAVPTRLVGTVLAVAVGVTFTLLTWAAAPDGELPPLARELAGKSVTEAYGRNVVNVILVDFRALDTLGEVFVLAIAAIGVATLLRVRAEEPRPTALGSQSTFGRSPILRAAARSIAPLLALISLVLLVRGHHEPGGGFVGGLVATAAALLHVFAFGVDVARARVLARRLIALGLAAVLAAGAIGLLAGGAFLQGAWLSGAVPAIGKLGTPLLFDIGVYLVVLGVTTGVLFGLLEREEAPA